MSAASGGRWTTRSGRSGRPWSAPPAAMPVPSLFPNGVEFMDRKRTEDTAVDSLERQIDAWRAHLRRSRAITGSDAEELEDHLREQISSLGADGLSEDEAFLVAVKRMGAMDALTREFAREHSDRLWKQLVLSRDRVDGGGVSLDTEGS